MYYTGITERKGICYKRRGRRKKININECPIGQGSGVLEAVCRFGVQTWPSEMCRRV